MGMVGGAILPNSRTVSYVFLIVVSSIGKMDVHA